MKYICRRPRTSAAGLPEIGGGFVEHHLQRRHPQDDSLYRQQAARLQGIAAQGQARVKTEFGDQYPSGDEWPKQVDASGLTSKNAIMVFCTRSARNRENPPQALAGVTIADIVPFIEPGSLRDCPTVFDAFRRRLPSHRAGLL